MDNSKKVKFNLNKLLLKMTAIVVIGAFCISTVLVDLAWAYSSRDKLKANSFLRQTSAGENYSLQKEIAGAIIKELDKEELKKFIEKSGGDIEVDTLKEEFKIIGSMLSDKELLRKDKILVELAAELGIQKEEMLNRIIQARDDLLKNRKTLKQFPDIVRTPNKYGLGLGTENYLGYGREILDRLKDKPALKAELLFHESLCFYFQELKGKEGHQIARQAQKILFPQNYKDVVPLEGDNHPELAGKLTLALREFIEGRVQSVRLDKDSESAAERRAMMDRKADAKDLSLSVILEELLYDLDSLSMSSEQFLLLTEVIDTKPDIVSINLVSSFLEMLKDNNKDAPVVAVVILGKMGKTDPALASKVVDSLLDLSTDSSEFIRQLSVTALGEIDKTDPKLSSRVVEHLLKMAEDKHWSVRQAVARSLGEIGKNNSKAASRVIDCLLELSKDEVYLYEIGIPQAAATALGKINKTDPKLASRAINRLLDMSKAPFFYYRPAAIKSLGKIGNIDAEFASRVTDYLLELLRDNNERIRREAATALGEIGKTDSTLALKMVNPLLERLKDKDEDIRQAAVTALGKIGKTNSALALEMVNLLLEMLKDNDWKVRRGAVAALGELGKTNSTLALKVINPVLEMLKDNYGYVRIDAVAALGEIRKTDSTLALKMVNPLLERLKDKDEDIRQAAVTALGKIGKTKSALALEMVNPLLEMLKDNDGDIRKEAVTALGKIGKTKSALALEMVNPLLEMLKDNDMTVRQEAVTALSEIGETDSALTLKVVNCLLDMSKDNTVGFVQTKVRQAAARGLVAKLKTADLERCHLYEKLIKEELKRDIPQRDKGFIIWSLAAVLSSDKRNIADEREGVRIVCQEFYPLFKKAEGVLEEVNSSLDDSWQYDEKLFWQRYVRQFGRLLSINPEAGLKFFEYNLRIKGEKVSGPQRMAYLFDDLKEVFYDSENTDSVSKILERISKKKLSMSGFGDILRVTQGCLLLKRIDLLKDFAGQAGPTNPKEIIEEIGKGLLTDLAKILEIDIAVDGKAVSNWLKYENPWGAIIAFTTFYKRFKEHNLDNELEIVKAVVENVLQGTYKKYRYDTNQLAMLSQKQKDIWMENEVSPVEERDISAEVIGKVGRIQGKIRDMVEHQHIQGFVREQLSLMLDNPGGNIEDLNGITTEARTDIKNRQPSLERIKEIKHFKDIKNIEEAESRLENLQIVRSLLILFNLSGEEIEAGKIGSKEGKKSLVKFINSLINSLDKMEERAAVSDITDLRDNILQPTKLAVKGQITIEDTDDPFILAMIGEKPVVTCQGYNHPNIEFFRCHPAYLADSNKRVVLVKRNDIPIARAVIRVMTKEDGKRVIFLERIYSSTGETFKRNILEQVLNKAGRMGIEVATKLDVGGIEAGLSRGGPLTSTGTRNVFEYVDALTGKQSGIWQIAEANILKPVKKVKRLATTNKMFDEKWGI